MRRWLVLLAATVPVLVLPACSAQTGATVPAATRLQTAAIAAVSKPVVVPKPRFTRTMYTATGLAGSGKKLDACAGPIAIELGVGWPVLVAQHDYCGGSGWIPRLNLGQGVRLKGDGVAAGIYVVKTFRYQLRGRARVSDLPQGDVVLQTCISKRRLILVGLEWVAS